MAEARGILHGWKDIASALDVSVRTAQRWERCAGLPVRRIAGGRGHSVLADAADLRAWLDAQSSIPVARRPVHAPSASAPPVRQPVGTYGRRRWEALRLTVARAARTFTRAAVVVFAAR